MRMFIRLSLGSVTLLLFSAMLTPALVEAQSVGPDAMAGCVTCVQCAGINRHALIVGHDDLIGAIHECMGPECPGPHSMCGIYGFRSVEEIDSLVLRIAGVEQDSLAHVLAAVVGNTILNPQRGVLQFRDCTGEIIAQVALSPAGLDLVRPIIIAGLVDRLQMPF